MMGQMTLKDAIQIVRMIKQVIHVRILLEACLFAMLFVETHIKYLQSFVMMGSLLMAKAVFLTVQAQ